MGHPAKVLPQQDSDGRLENLPLEVVKSRLDISGQGLSSAEAQVRLKQYGLNELPEEKVNPIKKFLAYFWGPIPWMIEVAAILSALLHHGQDFFIILALLLINAGVGFWEEFQAGSAGADPPGSGDQHSAAGNSDRCLRRFYGAARLALGDHSLGIRAGMVPCE